MFLNYANLWLGFSAMFLLFVTQVSQDGGYVSMTLRRQLELRPTRTRGNSLRQLELLNNWADFGPSWQWG